MNGLAAFWSGLGFFTFGVAAVVTLTAALWLWRRRGQFGPAGGAIVVALGLTGLWCAVRAATGVSGLATQLGEAIRNLAWIVVVFRLFASDGRHASLAPIRPVVIVLAAVEAVQIIVALLAAAAGAVEAQLFLPLTVVLRLLASVGALVLVHNLYLGAAPESRLVLRWPASALAVLWGFDLNLYAIAYLAGAWPGELAALRGLSVMTLTFLLVTGAARNREALHLRPSRAMAFQTVSLMLIGAYLLAMVGVAQWLAYSGGDFAQLMELGFLAAAAAVAVMVLASRRLRGWLRVTIAKHLFQHRYDYRAEWLRFNQTIGQGTDETQTFEERIVKAVADIADSSAGLLLLPDENGDLVLAVRWQWPAADVPAIAMAAAAAGMFERRGFIAELDAWRAGRTVHAEHAAIPAWLREEPRAWALVPLLHFERLTGVVVLAAPPYARKLDWEDFDLLRVVGQQLGSYLAEHAGQRALDEACRFDDFNRRIAFVMHDIKNLASQLGLLARNAEIHADKPAFRDDMLLTLRNSADKLNALLARLSRYGASSGQSLSEVDGCGVVDAVLARFKGVHAVVATEAHPCALMANADSLEQVLVHLVQNGVDASAGGAPVFLGLTTDGIEARFEVIDSGSGMSPDFVRAKLFRPFVSSKPGGFGIGAFEARELVRAMQGRIEVESREGLGSRFIVRLPLAETSQLRRAFGLPHQDVA